MRLTLNAALPPVTKKAVPEDRNRLPPNMNLKETYSGSFSGRKAANILNTLRHYLTLIDNAITKVWVAWLLFLLIVFINRKIHARSHSIFT